MITYREVLQQMLQDSAELDDRIGIKVTAQISGDSTETEYELDIIDSGSEKNGRLILYVDASEDLIAACQEPKEDSSKDQG